MSHIAIISIRIFIISIFVLILPGCTLIQKPENQPVSIKYWGIWDDATVMNQIREDYNKINPNVDVVYEKKSLQQYREALKAQINLGKGPDIFQFHNTWVPMLANELEEIPQKIISQNEFKEDYYPIVFADLRDNGKKFVGAPIGIDGLGLYYNEEIFEAAGIPGPPSTWQELAQIATKLTVRDTSGNIRTAGIALGAASNVDHFSDILGLMILQNGGDLKRPTGERSADALNYYVNFAKGENRVWDESMPRSTIAFTSGVLAIYLAPSWRSAEIKADNPQLKFKVAPVPQLAGGSTAWASYWAVGVSSKSPAKEEALKFLKYLQSNETIIKLRNQALKISDKYNGMPYPKKSLAQNIATDPFFGAYVADAPFMHSFPMVAQTFDNGLNDGIVKAYEEAISSTLSGAEASRSLNQAASDIAKILAQYPQAR